MMDGPTQRERDIHWLDLERKSDKVNTCFLSPVERGKDTDRPKCFTVPIPKVLSDVFKIENNVIGIFDGIDYPAIDARV